MNARIFLIGVDGLLCGELPVIKDQKQMEVAEGPTLVSRSSKKIVGFAGGTSGLEVHALKAQVLGGNVHGRGRLVHQEKLCVSSEDELLF